jgi:integrase
MRRRLFIERMQGKPRAVANFERWRAAALPIFGHTRINDLSPELICELIEPMMFKTYESGKRCREFVARVIDQANGRRRAQDQIGNPASFDATLALLSHVPKPKAGKRAALPWQDVPAIVAQLVQIDTPISQALILTILSGLRTQEARWARFDEFTADVWRVPVERMKVKDREDHVVPVSSGIAGVVARMRKDRISEYLFPGRKPGQPINQAAMRQLMYDLGYKGQQTVHGFRTCIRGWGGASVDGRKRRYDSEIMERVLSHEIGNKVQGAYDRDDFIEARAEIMEGWSQHSLSALPAAKRRHFLKCRPPLKLAA